MIPEYRVIRIINEVCFSGRKQIGMRQRPALAMIEFDGKQVMGSLTYDRLGNCFIKIAGYKKESFYFRDTVINNKEENDVQGIQVQTVSS